MDDQTIHTSRTGRPFPLRPLAIPSLFLLLGGILYWRVLNHGIFIFDDIEYILENPIVTNFWQVLSITDPRQLGYLSFSLNYLADPSWRPFGFHLMNVSIHVCTALMVYYVVRLLAGLPDKNRLRNVNSPEGHSVMAIGFIPLLASLLFLAHPLQTQAVSYVTQRFTALSTFFYVGAVLSYLRFRVKMEQRPEERVRFGLLVLSLCSTILAMRTKEISFTIPFVVAAFEALLFRDSSFGKRRLFLLIPFAATLILIPLALFGPDWGLASGGTGVDEITRRDKLFDLFKRSGPEYLMTQCRVVVTYLRLLLLPVNQLAVYDYSISKSPDPGVVFSALLHLCLIAGAWFAWTKAGKAAAADAACLRLASLGALWFYVTISIESSVIPIKDVIFEHRVYLPSIGFFLCVASGIDWLFRRLHAGPVRGAGAALLSGALVLLFSVATIQRNGLWVDEVAFWADVVNKTGKAIGYNNRGNAYYKRGELRLALQDFTTTVGFFPPVTDHTAWEHSDFTATNMGKTFLARGNIYKELGDYAHAEEDFRTAGEFMMKAKYGAEEQ